MEKKEEEEEEEKVRRLGGGGWVGLAGQLLLLIIPCMHACMGHRRNEICMYVWNLDAWDIEGMKYVCMYAWMGHRNEICTYVWMHGTQEK